MFFPEITKLSLIRMTVCKKDWADCSANPRSSMPNAPVPYLMTIRGCAPRLVLRTACETLPAQMKKRVLSTVKPI